MPETNIGGAVASSLATATTDYSVDTQNTDGVSDQKETTYTNSDWAQQLGYYKTIPELKSAIDAKARWAIGKGFTTPDESTGILLDTIKGNGKDTFNKILENLIVTKQIGGDAFAEIILDDEGNLANLKPLDPATVRIVANQKGMIIRYEQISKVKAPDKKFPAERIFHLMNKRVADEIHGTSDIDCVEEIILMRNEAMTDYKKLMHRHVVPRMVYKLDTDDSTEISTFKAKEDAANAAGENIYIPQKAVEFEVLAVSPNSTLNPLTWIQQLNVYFFQTINVPEIIVGGGTNNLTEASAKIAYLAFQQTTEREQLGVEEDCLLQLNIVIELTFPASLENEALSDKPKENQDGSEVNAPDVQSGEQAVEPNDQQAEIQGRK
jgi:hypothetical protein